jgi:hypothetical protein
LIFRVCFGFRVSDFGFSSRQLLNGHAPVEQPPPPQADGVGQAPDAQGIALAEATDALKVENCFSGFGAPQSGQLPGLALALATSFSNAWPHLRQRYS